MQHSLPLLQTMALVFSPEGDELLKLRCSACKETKEISLFPASCQTWRRGACKTCRKTKARSASILLKKLDSARHRYKSVRGIAEADLRALLDRCGLAGLDESELARQWCLAKIDAAQPLTINNATWVRRKRATSPPAPAPATPSAPAPSPVVMTKQFDEL